MRLSRIERICTRTVSSTWDGQWLLPFDRWWRVKRRISQQTGWNIHAAFLRSIATFMRGKRGTTTKQFYRHSIMRSISANTDTLLTWIEWIIVIIWWRKLYSTTAAWISRPHSLTWRSVLFSLMRQFDTHREIHDSTPTLCVIIVDVWKSYCMSMNSQSWVTLGSVEVCASTSIAFQCPTQYPTPSLNYAFSVAHDPHSMKSPLARVV